MSAGPAPIARALALLGKRNLVLSIHDPSFPGAPGEDLGRGSPYTRGGRDFLVFLADLGFTGVQLGPQGQTTAGNPSPYDAELFARNPLSIDLVELAEDPQWIGLLRRETLARIVADAPAGKRVDHAHVHAAHTAALAEVTDALAARTAALASVLGHRTAAATAALDPATAPATRDLLARIAAFTSEHRAWLAYSGHYRQLAAVHGEDWRRWSDASLRDLHLRDSPASPPKPSPAHAVVQYIAHRQHAALRTFAHTLDLKLFGDLQIGVSLPDLWAHRRLFLADYRMGAPPSRTNPAGQPWNYPVLDPAQYLAPGGGPGPVPSFMYARVAKLLAEFDGLRIDHPHGLICPWVYRADDPDPLHAVQTGARLFDSPDLPDHPALAAHAIARRDQLSPDPATPRHADDWVRRLDEPQVDAYARLLDVVIAAARAHHRDVHDILCEVLSTQPYPLRRVRERHHLGRFRVTQKADLADPADVYRSENAAPEDWIMVGNHDTPTIWELLELWQRGGTLDAQARHLAARLAPDDVDVSTFAAQLAADPGLLAQAKFADIFASPAQNVQIFFADLLGERARYNLPGSVGVDNWSLRVDPDYARTYPALRRRRAALDLPAILAMALRRRGQPRTDEHLATLAALDALAR